MADEQKAAPSKPKSDGLVSVRWKTNVRGGRRGQLRRLDPETADQLVRDGHAKYVGRDKP